MKKPSESIDQLRLVLDYRPLTGEFWWLHQKQGRNLSSPAGWVNPTDGYRYIGLAGGSFAAHRLAWYFVSGEWPQQHIDHINGDRHDNRAENIRLATHAENLRNSKTPRSNTSGFKGVSPSGRRWVSKISHEGRQRHLGTFATPEEAHEVYDLAAQLLHGRFYRQQKAATQVAASR